jgi:hypothetical protein
MTSGLTTYSTSVFGSAPLTTLYTVPAGISHQVLHLTLNIKQKVAFSGDGVPAEMFLNGKAMFTYTSFTNNTRGTTWTGIVCMGPGDTIEYKTVASTPAGSTTQTFFTAVLSGTTIT